MREEGGRGRRAGGKGRRKESNGTFLDWVRLKRLNFQMLLMNLHWSLGCGAKDRQLQKNIFRMTEET